MIFQVNVFICNHTSTVLGDKNSMKIQICNHTSTVLGDKNSMKIQII
jgi:hypothetical protein